jgi:hypothetical protein
MADEHRVTIRLSPALYAQLEARGSHGQPMAAIVRDALMAYLDRQPAAPPTPELRADTVAAMAASLADLQQQVQILTARVEALAADRQPPAATRQARPRQPAAAPAAINQDPQRQPPAAMTADTRPSRSPQPRAGRPRSALGQRILRVLGEHPEGLTAEQIRVYASPERPIGDLLSGMKRTGVVQTKGQGRTIRYVLAHREA